MEYKAFVQRWVESLMESMDDHLDAETRVELIQIPAWVGRGQRAVS